MANLQDLWKLGNAEPLPTDIPEGGLAIDIANKKAYSSDGTDIFEIGKQVSDNSKVDKAGDTMTGNLIIGDGTSGSMLEVMSSGGAGIEVRFTRQDDTKAARLYFNKGDDNFKLQKYSLDGETILTTLTIGDNGNALVNGLEPTEANHLTRKDYVDAQIAIGTPGVMFDFGGATAPTGSLACNGQEVAIADYQALYDAIGDLWSTTGGASTPTAGNFRLPLQEMDGEGVYNRGKGASTSVGEYQDDTLKSHLHSASHDHTGSFSGVSLGAHSHYFKNYNGRRMCISGLIAGSENATYDSIFADGVTNYGKVPSGLDGSDTLANRFTSIETDDSDIGTPSGTVTVDSESMNTGETGDTVETRPKTVTVLKCIWTGK